MKKLFGISLVAIAGIWLAACGGAGNTNTSNTGANSNSSKPTAAAPTADQLFALDQKANEAYLKGDFKHFDGILADKVVMDGARASKAEAIKMMEGVKCEVKDGWKLEEPQMSKIDADTYVLSYKGNFDGSCTRDGKSMKIPSPIRAASVWVRSGNDWKVAFHEENLIIDPKNPPAPAKPEAVKEDSKKDAATKDEPKKDEAKKEETPKETPDANTDALVKIHTSGWEAFKARDAKKFNEISTSDLSIVDPAGNWFSGQANVVKLWTETMKCEGITEVSVSDGFASALSPTVEILTLKGSADGTCDGQKNGELHQTAFYVKQGEAWKLAFMFESTPK